MKRFYFILAFMLAAFTASATLGTIITGQVGLSWSYAAEPSSTNLFFNIYATPDPALPSTNWALVTNATSSSILDTNAVGGTNYHVTVNMNPGHFFFAASSTNFWGESDLTTNIVVTPPAPQLINTLKIQKLP